MTRLTVHEYAAALHPPYRSEQGSTASRAGVAVGPNYSAVRFSTMAPAV